MSQEKQTLSLASSEFLFMKKLISKISMIIGMYKLVNRVRNSHPEVFSGKAVLKKVALQLY